MPYHNEFWLLSVDEWDEGNRVEDEEYYAFVQSVDLTKDPMECTVQDVEEAVGPEVVLQNRHRLNVFVCGDCMKSYKCQFSHIYI